MEKSSAGKSRLGHVETPSLTIIKTSLIFHPSTQQTFIEHEPVDTKMTRAGPCPKTPKHLVKGWVGMPGEGSKPRRWLTLKQEAFPSRKPLARVMGNRRTLQNRCLTSRRTFPGKSGPSLFQLPLKVLLIRQLLLKVEQPIH